uniref:Uncharacterized protein n=1 Tax=uncultured organism BAC21E04 TaxID=382346 RepID=Q5Y1B0_9ZZZZ|nr:hypothetical protein [uncultured organism BAC21E04]
MVIGHTKESLEELAKKIGATNVDDVLRFLSGNDFATKAQSALIDKLGGEQAQLARNAAGNPTIGAKVARFAGGNSARNLLRVVPGLSTALVALDAADVVAGPDSLGNKAMDATAMGVGGTIGGIMGLGNPFAIATGANLGKMASDATQFVFGGGKSAEQRKLEEALKLLQQRGLV